MPIMGPSTSWPFAQISFDFITNLPMSDGFDSLMVVVDHGLSKGVILSLCHKMIDATGDEHAWLLPLEITLIALVYSSFKLIWAPAIIITLFRPLLWCCNCLLKTLASWKPLTLIAASFLKFYQFLRGESMTQSQAQGISGLISRASLAVSSIQAQLWQSPWSDRGSLLSWFIFPYHQSKLLGNHSDHL